MLVLNGRRGPVRISEATRASVMDAADRLGYTPNHAAQNLRRRQSKAITLIVQRIGSPYFTDIAEAAIDAAKGHGYEIDIVDADGPDGEREALLRLRGGRADGVIVSTARPALCSTRPPSVRSGTVARLGGVRQRAGPPDGAPPRSKPRPFDPIDRDRQRGGRLPRDASSPPRSVIDGSSNT